MGFPVLSQALIIFRYEEDKMKIKWKESSLCRVILFLLGITLFLGVYTAFTVPLFLSTKVLGIWLGGLAGGVLLMIVFHRVIMTKYREGFSASSTAGQLCIAFLFFMLGQYQYNKRLNDVSTKFQSAISILMFIISLALYIYQKIKDKSLQKQNP